MSTSKSSLEAQLFQSQENNDNLSVEKETFVQDRAVLKQEIVDLHDKLAIATAEVSISVWYNVRVSSRIKNLGERLARRKMLGYSHICLPHPLLHC